MEDSGSQLEKSKRFFEVLKYFGLNQVSASKRIGLSQSKISEIKNLKAGKNILNDIFYRLYYEFGISKEWWDTGEGEMFELKESFSNKDFAAESVEGYEKVDWKSKHQLLLEKYINVVEENNMLLKGKLQELINPDKRNKAI